MTTNLRISLKTKWSTLALFLLGLLLVWGQAVRAQSSHTHQWIAYPPLSDGSGMEVLFGPNPGQSGPYLLPAGCVVEIKAVYSPEDYDTCEAHQISGDCNFEDPNNPQQALARNEVEPVRWEVPAGEFGYLSNNTFVPSSDLNLITHYKAPATPGDYTLKLVIKDDGKATDPETGASVTTVAETKDITGQVTVTSAGPGTWAATPAISGGGIQAPASGATVAPLASVDLSAATATDKDTFYPQSGCFASQATNTVTYSWSVTNSAGSSVGTFTSGNTGQNVTWKAPSTTGTYTITLTVDDAGDSEKPTGDGGTRNDAPLQFTRTLNVQTGTWGTDTPIACDGIELPADTASTTVASGGQLSLKAHTATDRDKYTAPDGTVTYPSDECTYTWEAKDGAGQPVGSFSGGNTGQNVSWTPPSTGSGLVTITLKVDDRNDANKPALDNGTRNDAALTAAGQANFARVVNYHTHEFQSDGNEARVAVSLLHVDDTAVTEACVGEILKLDRSGIDPLDFDTCVQPNCPFPDGKATEIADQHEVVRYEDNGKGTFGKLSADDTFTEVPASQVDEATHYRVDESTGPLEVWAVVDDAGVALDPSTNAEVNTVNDPEVDGPKATASITDACQTAVDDALHRNLDADDACGCPACLAPGNSGIDPRTGAVVFTVPVTNWNYRGLSLDFNVTYNSKAKVDRRFGYPQLNYLGLNANLAHLSQRNSRWTHNWAQFMEVVFDGTDYHALWHTGDGGSVGFLGQELEAERRWVWQAKDSEHALVSRGEEKVTIRLRPVVSSTSGCGNTAECGPSQTTERVIQTTVHFGEFDLEDADGTIYHFAAPVRERGLGATFSYYPLQSITDRWGRTVVLNWGTDGRLTSVVDGNGRGLSFQYDAHGLLQSVQDTHGRSHTFAYGSFADEYWQDPMWAGQWRMLTQINVTGPGVPSTGYQWQFDYGTPLYDSQYYNGTYTGDLVIRKQEPSGKLVHYRYTGVDPDPAQAAHWDGRIQETWYADQGVTRTITRQGTTLIYPGNVAHTYGYAGHAVSSVREEATGREVHYRYDALNNLTKVWTNQESETSPLVSFEHLFFPGSYRIQKTTATNVLGDVVETQFGPYNLPITTLARRRPTGGQAYDQLTRFYYDGVLTPGVGQPNNVTRVERAAVTNVTHVWDAVNFTYGAVGAPDQPASSTDLVNRTWTYAYDAVRGLPTQVGSPVNTLRPVGHVDHASSVTVLSYHADGLPYEITDPVGRKYRLTYAAVTAGSNQLQVTFTNVAAGNSRSVVVDAEGQVVSVTNEEGVQTRYEYNLSGQLLSVKVYDGATLLRTTTYTYNAQGSLAAIIPPRGANSTVWFDYRRYTQLGVLVGGETDSIYEGKVTRIQHPDGSLELFGYDAGGNLEWDLSGQRVRAGTGGPPIPAGCAASGDADPVSGQPAERLRFHGELRLR